MPPKSGYFHPPMRSVLSEAHRQYNDRRIAAIAAIPKRKVSLEEALRQYDRIKAQSNRQEAIPTERTELPQPTDEQNE